MGDKRIFLAFDISDAARDVCASHIRSLRQRFPEVRVGWERTEKLHITLKFLGKTSSENLAKLEAEIRGVAATYDVPRLRLSKAGVFPSSSRPRILWIGLETISGAIEPLYNQLEDITQSLGFDKERRHFRPHITIGRVRDPHGVSELAAVHLQTEIEPVEFEAAEIVIYESKLQPAGSVYEAIAPIPLSRQQ